MQIVLSAISRWFLLSEYDAAVYPNTLLPFVGMQKFSFIGLGLGHIAL